MGVAELLHEIEGLPPKKRRVLFTKIRELEEAEILETLRQSVAEADRGELVDLK